MKDRYYEVLRVYSMFDELKNKLRTGWIEWNVDRKRIEDISNHTFGCCILAILVHSEFDLYRELDIGKIVKMLVLHETEEIGIGDITPFDGISPEEKRKQGLKVVEKVFSEICNGNELIELIKEFEEGKTKESCFAKRIDKVEAILQSSLYTDEGSLDFEKGAEFMKNDEIVKKMYEEGNTRVSEMFAEFHRNVYKDTVFEQIVYSALENNMDALKKNSVAAVTHKFDK